VFLQFGFWGGPLRSLLGLGFGFRGHRYQVVKKWKCEGKKEMKKRVEVGERDEDGENGGCQLTAVF
jgi:hypothetical protein